MKVQYDILAAMDNQNVVLLVMLDHSAVYDNVDQETLFE